MTVTYAMLMAEAEDPRTPGKRLREIYFDAGRPKNEVTEPILLAMIERNPNLLADDLHDLLFYRRYSAWFNPSLELRLLEKPDPELWSSALHTLRAASTNEKRREVNRLDTLEEVVAYWACVPLLASGPTRAQKLAQRLATLFHLPWPERR